MTAMNQALSMLAEAEVSWWRKKIASRIMRRHTEFRRRVWKHRRMCPAYTGRLRELLGQDFQIKVGQLGEDHSICVSW